MPRLQWLPHIQGHFALFRSACGRFQISYHRSKPGYFALHDTTTVLDHVCRTIASAKALAKDLGRGTSGAKGE